MCQQTGTQQVKQNTMEQTIRQTTQQEYAFQAVQLQPNAVQAHRTGAQMAQLIQNQAEMAQADVQQALGEVPQERVQERAHLSKAEKRALKRQQREQEQQRRQQEEERLQREHAEAEQRRQEAEQRRQEALQEQARERTEAHGVVHGVSREDWARHGGASYHYTVTEQQAQRIIEASKGCLYAKPVAEGLVELRPTLPETVEIGGKQIPFRRNYNLLMKAVASSILDEKGALMPDAVQFADKLLNALGGGEFDENKVSNRLAAVLLPAMKKLYPKEGDAKKAYADVYNMITSMPYVNQGIVFGYCLPTEILDALKRFTQTMEDTDATHFAVAKEKLRKDLQADVDARRMSQAEMQSILDGFQNPGLMDHKERIKSAMQKEGRSEQEQQQLLQNVTSMYADLDAARLEFMRMREMDIDGREVFLPNACSANGAFFAALDHMRTADEQTFLSYDTHEHYYAHKMQHVNYVLEHFSGTKEEREKIEDLKKKLERGEALTNAEDTEIYKPSAKVWKYNYHVAANLGQVDDMQLTIEQFAAETVQFVVSPFSTKGAIGLYRGKAQKGTEERHRLFISEGMIAYYNHDDPIPSDEMMPLSDTKGAMVEKRLPGDRNYVPGGQAVQQAEQKGEEDA